MQRYGFLIILTNVSENLVFFSVLFSFLALKCPYLLHSAQLFILRVSGWAFYLFSIFLSNLANIMVKYKNQTDQPK